MKKHLLVVGSSIHGLLYNRYLHSSWYAESSSRNPARPLYEFVDIVSDMSIFELSIILGIDVLANVSLCPVQWDIHNCAPYYVK